MVRILLARSRRCALLLWRFSPTLDDRMPARSLSVCRTASVALALALSGVTASKASAQIPTIEQVSGTTVTLIGVSAVDAQTVWVAGGAPATVLRTLDGGSTWQSRPVPGTEELQFRDVHAISRDEAWVLSIGNGSASRIYHTTDGGANWRLQFQNADSAAFYDCLTFFDAKRGVAFSDAVNGRTLILRTEDGGAHWALLPPDAVPAPLQGEGGYASSGGCVTSHGPRHGWIATTHSRVFRTDDAGRTWSASLTPLAQDSTRGLKATAWHDTRLGVAVGGTVVGRRVDDTTSAAVAFTTDGGSTWTLGERPPPGSLMGATWLRDGTAIVAASEGGLMVSPDAGASWIAANTHRYWSVGGVGSRAWVVGTNGRITRVDLP
jgi:photosystem II stability/assembly factor-like uncharacterized protein